MKFRFYTICVAVLCLQHIAAQPSYPTNPADAEIIYADVMNFIDAYNALSTEKDSIQVLQSLYFNKASIGMKEYINRFGLSPESLVRSITKHSKEYGEIEKFYNTISVIKDDYTKEMKGYKKVLPNAMFPPTYLIVGDFSGYANASKVGQLVTIERTINNLEGLKNLFIHELTHFQQAMSMGIQKYSGVYSKKNNMLDLILREGAAEFITYKLVRRNVDQFKKLKTYEQKEPEYWDRFQEDIKKQDKTLWLVVPKNEDDRKKPWFLGYCLGYKIVEAFYNQSEDKIQALEEILKMDDVEEFLRASNYSPSN